MSIWTDNQINQWLVDAEQDINKRVPSLIYYRFCLQITQGVSVYTLPSFVRTVSRVTWLGRKLDPVNWDELTYLTPATAILQNNAGGSVNSVVSRPLYYAKHPTNPYDIRLYPTPNLSLAANAQNPYQPLPETATQNQACIVACWRSVDSTFADPTSLLPSYIDRRTRKAFVAWKAFESEGKGQNLKAAAYYKALYEEKINTLIQINQVPYLAKRYAIEDGLITIDGFRYPRPILPANFERIIY